MFELLQTSEWQEAAAKLSDGAIRHWLRDIAIRLLEEAKGWDACRAGQSPQVQAWVDSQARYLRQVAGWINGNLVPSHKPRELAISLSRLMVNRASCN